ncbi:hypothetical protein D3C86_989410 [compost metagenome]
MHFCLVRHIPGEVRGQESQPLLKCRILARGRVRIKIRDVHVIHAGRLLKAM